MEHNKLKKKVRKNKNDCADVDEFDEFEEENFLQNTLQQKQSDDENLQVYLIEA